MTQESITENETSSYHFADKEHTVRSKFIKYIENTYIGLFLRFLCVGRRYCVAVFYVFFLPNFF